MNLQPHIHPDLWFAISKSYEAENYSHAILDAMHHLSNFLRDKSGADGDGQALAGQALGGDSPRLRVNKLQTETEKSIQKGMEQLVRGLYMAIRNPRAHEQVQDKKDDADAIICSINYILGVLGQSEEPFTVHKFLDQLNDPDFVDKERYAELLVSEIPPNRLLDALLAMYNQNPVIDGIRFGFVFSKIIARLSPTQLKDFLIVVSNELRKTHDNNLIKLTFQILPPQMWENIDEQARLRIENKVTKWIRESIFQSEYETDSNADPFLATYAKEFMKYFLTKDELTSALLWELTGKYPYMGVGSYKYVYEHHSDYNEDTDEYEEYAERVLYKGGTQYVLTYFMKVMPDILHKSSDVENFVKKLSDEIRQKSYLAESNLLLYISGYPQDWQKKFVSLLHDLTDENNPAIILPDGTPFLTEPQDIPF